MVSTPVDLYLPGEENASGGLFQLVVSASVVVLLGQKNVLTAGPRAARASSKELPCSEMRERLGDEGREADHRDQYERSAQRSEQEKSRRTERKEGR